MKKIGILLTVLITILFIPFIAFAEEDKEVNVYLFRGEGCPHCQEAEEFFDSIEEEYGQFFKLVDYETWYDTDNAELLEKVAEARKEDVEGVPYIIIGDKSWSGYASSYNESIIETIKAEYDKELSKRYDIMNLINSGEKIQKSYAGDVVILIITLVVVAGIVVGIIFARKRTN